MLVIRLTQLAISGELKGSLILADMIGSYTIKLSGYKLRASESYRLVI